jgi:hypothetical protein
MEFGQRDRCVAQRRKIVDVRLTWSPNALGCEGEGGKDMGLGPVNMARGLKDRLMERLVCEKIVKTVVAVAIDFRSRLHVEMNSCCRSIAYHSVPTGGQYTSLSRYKTAWTTQSPVRLVRIPLRDWMLKSRKEMCAVSELETQYPCGRGGSGSLRNGALSSRREAFQGSRMLKQCMKNMGHQEIASDVAMKRRNPKDGEWQWRIGKKLDWPRRLVWALVMVLGEKGSHRGLAILFNPL